jgi:hypothetical protein
LTGRPSSGREKGDRRRRRTGDVEWDETREKREEREGRMREDLVDTSRRGREVVRRMPEEINSIQSKIRV